MNDVGDMLSVAFEKTAIFEISSFPPLFLFDPACIDHLDCRFKAFLSEISVDEASPEWGLRPQEIFREVRFYHKELRPGVDGVGYLRTRMRGWRSKHPIPERKSRYDPVHFCGVNLISTICFMVKWLVVPCRC